MLIYLGQDPATAVAHVACWKAGLISVPTSLLFGTDALAYRLRDSGAKLLITDAAHFATVVAVREQAPELAHVMLVDGRGRWRARFLGRAGARLRCLRDARADARHARLHQLHLGNHRPAEGHAAGPPLDARAHARPRAGLRLPAASRRRDVVAGRLVVARRPDGRPDAGLVLRPAGADLPQHQLRPGRGVPPDGQAPRAHQPADADDAAPPQRRRRTRCAATASRCAR